MMACARVRRHLRRAILRRGTGEPVTEITRELTEIDRLALTVVRPARAAGLPLLFIHGLFAGAWMFERWMQYFAERGRAAYAVDLRGHGSSDAIDDQGRVGLGDYVADALGAVRAVDRAVVVGHSLGGLIAQKLAELGALRAAVLVSPAPPRGISPLSLRLMARQAKYLPALLLSREIRVGRDDADAIILNRVPFAERATVFSRFEPDSGRAGREITLGAIAVDQRRVRCPMLVLAGDEDRFIPLRVARRVAAKYGAPLRILPGRGHLMMREPGWAEAAAEIEKWVESL
ncbi:MAG: alpha/beta hydrolase [Gemmatimonadaceae bacterium]